MKKHLSVLLAFILTFCVLLPAFAAEAGELSVYSSNKIPSGSMRMTAHRGYSSVAPENTLPAFRLAGEYGFWGAECDTSPTADGVWVIMHDDTVDRMTDGEGKVRDLTWAEISGLTIDSGSNAEDYPDTKVPTLTEYLDVCKEYCLHPVIEIKGCATVDDMDSLAELLSAREEILTFTIISFSRELLVRIKELLPEVPAYLLITVGDDEGSIDFCKANGIDGIDFVHVLDDKLIKKVVSSGLYTMSWTVDDIGSAERLYKLGIRDITTNSLTQLIPDGNIFQELIWWFRDLFAAFKSIFAF
ncbi:MAG: hypothetical protein K6G90_04835 [Clostridia bacterium]|nr:hypothetical protein [Clostridia bacterium]